MAPKQHELYGDVDVPDLSEARRAWADDQWDPDSGIPWSYHAAAFDRLVETLCEQALAEAAASGRPTPTQAQDAGMDFDLEARALRARGAVHQLDVMPNENHTGWVLSVTSPLGAANLPQAQAQVLARLLLAGPGSGPQGTCAHGLPTTQTCPACAGP